MRDCANNSQSTQFNETVYTLRGQVALQPLRFSFFIFSRNRNISRLIVEAETRLGLFSVYCE
jgi:hypothetical protein